MHIVVCKADADDYVSITDERKVERYNKTLVSQFRLHIVYQMRDWDMVFQSLKYV